MITTIARLPAFIALVLISVAITVTKVEAVACSGSCGATIFNSGTASLCDMVSIDVTGTTSGTLVGGDIYRINTALDKAAVHMGLATNGQAVTIYAFWAGTRSAFHTVVRNGLSSSNTDTDDFGIILSATTTCPTFDAASYPVTNLQASWTNSYGAGYYSGSTYLNAALLLSGIVAEGSTAPLVYVHNTIVDHRELLATTTGTRTSWAWSSSAEAYAMDESPTHTYDPNVTRIYSDGRGTVTGSCYGWGVTRQTSNMHKAAVHAGVVTHDEPEHFYAIYVGERAVFYGATMNGEWCSAVYIGGAGDGAYVLSKTATLDPTLALDPITYPNVTVGYMEVDVDLTTPYLVGTTYYKYDGDLADIAFHADLIALNGRGRMYVHHIDKRDVFYASDFRGMLSGSSASYEWALYASLSPDPPTDDDLRRLRLRFSKAYSITGTSFYTINSELSTAAFHAGLLKVGETKTFYAHDLGMRPRHFRADNQGIVSGAWNTPYRSFAFSVDTVRPTAFDAEPYPLRIHGGDLTCSSMWGTGIYTWDSDVACAAQHMGIVPVETEGTAWVWDAGTQIHYYRSHIHACGSSAYGSYPGFAVRPTADPYTIPVVGTDPLDVNITADQLYGSTINGVGVYKDDSDLKRIAIIEGLLKLGETKVLYVHMIGSPPPVHPATCVSGLCSATTTSPGTRSIAMSETTANPQNGLPSTTVRVSLLFNPPYDSSAITGFRETGYASTLGSVARMAFHANLLEPLTRTTLYMHYVGSCNRFFRGYNRGILSTASVTTAYETMVLSSSPTPPAAFSCAVRQFTACLHDPNYDTAPMYGTSIYTADSCLNEVAFHDHKLNYGECKQLWVHETGLFTKFYSAQTRDSVSSYWGSSFQSMMLTTTAAAPTVPAASVVPINVAYYFSHYMYPVGAGHYRADRDLAVYAFLEGLVQYSVETPTLLYAHDAGTPARFYSKSTNGYTTTYGASSFAAVILSASATPPTLVAGRQEALVSYTSTNALSSSNCYGADVVYWYCDVTRAAVREGLVGPGATTTLYIFEVATQNYFVGSSNNDITMGSYTTTNAGYILRAAPTPVPTTPAADGPWELTTTLTRVPTGTLQGTYVYTHSSCAYTAAYHQGILKVGVATTFYVHKIATFPRFYASTMHGLTSYAVTTARAGFIVSTSAAAPAAPSTTMQTFTITVDRQPSAYSNIAGAGYFQISADVTAACARSGLVKVGETKTVYVHYIGSHDRWYKGNMYTSYTASPADGYYPSLSSAPHTPTPNVVPIRMVAAPRSGWVYGAGVYRADSPIDQVAVHSGLVKWGEEATVYVHDIGTANNFYAAKSSGLQSYSYFSASGYAAMILSLSPTPPSGAELPTATVSPVTIRFTFAEDFPVAYGSGRYTRTSDVTTAAYLNGLFDEDTAMPFTFYVHDLGISEKAPSSYHGWAGSSRHDTTTTPMIGLSTSTAAAPACVKNPAYVFAYVRGQNERGNLYVSTAGDEYYYTSDPGRAAVFQGLLALGEGKVLRIERDDVSTTTPYPVQTANGVTSSNSGSTNKQAFKLYDDQSCTWAGAFPAATGAVLTETCTGDCSATHFTQGSTPVNTVATVVLRGTYYWSSMYGAGYYRFDQQWSALAVHAGVLKPDEVKTIYVFYVGELAYFHAARINGVRTYGTDYVSTPRGAVYFSTTNTPPTVTAGVTPITVNYGGHADAAYGAGVFAFDSPIQTAAYAAGLIDISGADAKTTVYAHTFASASYTYQRVCARGHLCTLGAINSATDAMILTAAATPAPAAPDNTKTEITLHCNRWENHATHYGIGYFKASTDLCRSAYAKGWFQGTETSKTVWVHNIIDFQYFLGGDLYGHAASAQSLSAPGAAYALELTSTAPTVVAGVVPVTVDATSSGLYYYGSVKGMPRAYSMGSNVKAALIHQGLLTDGNTWSGFAHFANLGSKDVLHALTLNGIESDSEAWSATVPRKLLGFDASSTPLASDGLTSAVTEVTLPTAHGYRHRTLQGTTVYSYVSDVTLVATHGGVTSHTTGGVVRYLHHIGKYDLFLASLNNGIASTHSVSSYDAFVLSTSPTTFDASKFKADGTGVQVTLKFNTPWGVGTSYGFMVYAIASDLLNCAWHAGLGVGGQTVTTWVHADRTATKAIFAGRNNGYYLNGRTNTHTIWFSPNSDPAAANTNPMITRDELYVFRGLRSPSFSRWYHDKDLYVYGTGLYTQSSSITGAATHLGLLPRDGTPTDIYFHVVDNDNVQPQFVASKMRGVPSYSSSNSKAFAVSATATNPWVSGRREVPVLCDSSVKLAFWGTRAYTFSSDLCRAAVHEGLLPWTHFDYGHADRAVTTLYIHERTGNNFFTSSRRGQLSTWYYSAAAYQAYMVTTTTATPAFDQDHFEVDGLWTGYNYGTVYGVQIYRANSEVGWSAYLCGLASWEEAVTAWVHQMGPQVYFPYMYVRSERTYTSSADTNSFQLTLSSTAPAANDGSRFAVPLVTTYHSSSWGTGAATFSSCLSTAAYFAGAVRYGDHSRPVVHFYRIAGTLKRFYRTQRGNGGNTHYYSAGGYDAYYISSEDFGASAPSEITATRLKARVTVSEFSFSTISGTGTYRADSTYLDGAAFHAGMMQVGDTQDLYIHNVGTVPHMYATLNRGVLSTYSTNFEAFSFTYGPAIPATSMSVTRLMINLDIYGGGTLVGAGAYSKTSVVNLAAFHSGLMNMGEERAVFIHDVGTRDRFFTTARNGITSSSSWSAADAYYLWHTDYLPPCVLTPESIVFRVYAPLTTWYGVVYGGIDGYYERRSVVSKATVHAGILARGTDGQMNLTYVTNYSYPPLTRNGITSYTAVDSDGYYLNTTSCGVDTPTKTATATISQSQTASRSAATVTLSVPPTKTPDVPTPAPTPAPPTPVPPTPAPPPPTPTVSRSLVPPPTRTREMTRTPDLPTPAPPTPIPTPAPPPPPPTPTVPLTVSKSLPPTKSLELPTPAPPPPPPYGSILTSLTIGAGGAAPLRRSDYFTVSALSSFLYVSPVNNTEPTLVVTFTAATQGVRVPACAELPPQCQRSADGSGALCRIPYFTGATRYFAVDFVLSLDASAGPARVDVTATMDNWAAGAVEAALHTTPPTAVQAATVTTVLDNGVLPSAVTIASVAPAMNNLSYGTAVELAGNNLQLLPALLPLGPNLCAVSVGNAGTTATVYVPGAASAWTRTQQAAALAVTADMLAVVVPADHARRYYACDLLTSQSLVNLDTLRTETAAGNPVNMRRVNVDFIAGQVMLNSIVAPTAAPPTLSPGQTLAPGATVAPTPPPPAIIPSTTTGPDGAADPVVVIPVFVPSTTPVDPAVVQAEVTLPGQATPTPSNTIVAQTPVTNSDGDVVGYMVSFEFNGTIAPAASSPGAPSASSDIASTANTAVVGGGNGNVDLRVTVRNSAMHTTTTTTSTFAIPTYIVTITAVPPYRARVVLRLSSGAGITNLRVLAFTDRELSVRPFPTRSDDASCSYSAVNYSTACRTSSLGADGPVNASTDPAASRRQTGAGDGWGFELHASPPSYFTGDIIVRIHIRADDAVWKELVIRLSSDAAAPSALGEPGQGGLLVAAPSPSGGVPAPVVAQPVRNPDGSVATAAPTPVPLPPPPPVDLTTTAAPVFADAVAKGIFSMSGSGCNTAPVNFLAATIAAYLLVCAVRAVISVVKRRSTTNAEDLVRTHDVSAARSLLMQHLYMSFIVPCHHWCGPAHTTLLFAHVMAMYAASTSVFNAYRDVSRDGYISAIALSLASAVAAGLTQPVFGVLFSMHREIDRRTYHCADAPGYAPQDLQDFGFKPRRFVGVAAPTQSALKGIAFDDETGPQMASPSVSPGANYLVSDVDVGDLDLEEWAEGKHRPSPPVKLPEKFTSITQAANAPASVSESVDPSDTQTMNDGEDRGEYAARLGVSCVERDPRDCVQVDAWAFSAGGHVVALVACVGFALLVANNTKMWCDTDFAEYWLIFVAQLVTDVALVQPFIVLLVFAWRWMIHDADDDDENETTANRVVHQLHPIHGQWRYVGAVSTDVTFDTTPDPAPQQPDPPAEL